MVTYGDGLADVDLNALLDFHKAHGKMGTVTVVRPPLRFGIMDLRDDDSVARFREKPQSEDWVSADQGDHDGSHVGQSLSTGPGS